MEIKEAIRIHQKENIRKAKRLFDEINDEECLKNIEVLQIINYVLGLFEAYQKIGTLDECRQAKIKQLAKTPDYEGDGYADGQLVYDTWICPNCGEHYEVGYQNYDCCPKCGQHIQHEDWESE